MCSTNLNEIFCQRGEPIDTCIRRHSNGHITNAFQLEITDQAKDGSVLERPFDSSKFLIRPPDDAVNSGFPIPDRQQGVGQYVQWSSRPLPYHQSFYHSNDKWLTSASSGPFQRGDEVSDRPGEQTFGNVVDYKDIPSNERLELSIQVPQVQLSGGLQPFHRLTSNPIPPFARPIWNVLHNKPKPGFLSGLSKPMQGIATNHSTDKIYIHAKDVVIDTGPKIFITSSKPFGNTLNTLENLMSQPTMFPTTLFSKPSSWNNMLPKLLSNALGTKSLIEALKTKPLITNANIGAVGKLLNLLLKTQRIDREPENHTPSISTISDNTKSPATLWTPATDVKHGAAYPLHLQTPVTTKNFDSSKAGYSGQNVVGMINEFHPLLNIYDEYISAHQNQTGKQFVYLTLSPLSF